MRSDQKLRLRNRRNCRVNHKLQNVNMYNDRLSIKQHTSNKHMYIHVLDLKNNITLLTVTTNSKEFKEKSSVIEGCKSYNNQGADLLGRLAGEKICDLKNHLPKSMVIIDWELYGEFDKFYFNRGKNLYHGRVKTVAESMRKVGVKI